MTGRDILPFHLTLQMVHRVLAVLILALVIGTLMVARKAIGSLPYPQSPQLCVVWNHWPPGGLGNSYRNQIQAG